MLHKFRNSLKLSIKGRNSLIRIEEYYRLEKLESRTKHELHSEISSLLTKCWGPFPSHFIDQHIFHSDKILIARTGERSVGFCVMSFKQVLGVKIHYVEFLVVDPSFQKSGLGSHLFFVIIREEIIRDIWQLLMGKPLEIFFITPNVRVLCQMAKFSSFIYPNPNLRDANGRIFPADEKTWDIALELLKNSDNPHRELEREALVLKDSYATTPWLIYNNDTAPWHAKDEVNVFAKRYLRYHKNEEREFMVRAHINLFSVIRYLFLS